HLAVAQQGGGRSPPAAGGAVRAGRAGGAAATDGPCRRPGRPAPGRPRDAAGARLRRLIGSRPGPTWERQARNDSPGTTAPERQPRQRQGARSRRSGAGPSAWEVADAGPTKRVGSALAATEEAADQTVDDSAHGAEEALQQCLDGTEAAVEDLLATRGETAEQLDLLGGEGRLTGRDRLLEWGQRLHDGVGDVVDGVLDDLARVGDLRRLGCLRRIGRVALVVVAGGRRAGAGVAARGLRAGPVGRGAVAAARGVGAG